MAEEDPAERRCANCDAPLAPDQEWCLQCGTAAPGALAPQRSPRTLGTLVALTTVLVLAAAAAAAYAFTRPPRRILTRPPTVASATPPPTTPAPPTTTTPAPVVPTTPTIPKVTPTPAPTATTPAAVTPKPAPTTTTSTHATTTPAATPKPKRAVRPVITLDTNAASDYNPNALPAYSFGDPSLAIDGDRTTAWTVAVNPAQAPNLDAGLLLDLHSPMQVYSLQLVTATPGITIEILGDKNGKQAPPTAVDPAWVRLAGPRVTKRRQTFKLRTKGAAFRWLLIWIPHVAGPPGPPIGTTSSVSSSAGTSVALDGIVSTTTTGVLGPSGSGPRQADINEVTLRR